MFRREQNRPPIHGSDLPLKEYTDVFNNFKASYFAGALLIDKRTLANDITSFFREKVFKPILLQRMIEKYGAGPEVFFIRLSQVIPHAFGINNIFFLKAYQHNETKKFDIAKEVHLGRLHAPHQVATNENYCERWVTKYIFNEFKKTDTSLISVQISNMYGSDDSYLCLTLAKKSSLLEDSATSFTLGLQITSKLKELIGFIDDKKIISQEVGQTCERCPLRDCNERSASPTIFGMEEAMKRRNQHILNTINKL